MTHGRVRTGPISLLDLESYITTLLRGIGFHAKFNFTGPKAWPVVSCGLVAVLGMIGCRECPLTRPVLARSWCQDSGRVDRDGTTR